MNVFAEAVKDLNNGTLTTNGMAALKSSRDAIVDLFYNIGSMRGKDVIPLFVKAYTQDREVALRVAQWARDVRGGAGERKIFRDILAWLDKNDPDAAVAVLQNTPEIGRWDDVLQDFSNDYVSGHAFRLVADALISEKNGLVAKWLPRKGFQAAKIRSLLGWSPKRYRKTIVGLTKVVEQQMCAKDWDNINYSHVPSLASARYKKAFGRHSATYAEYIQKLVKGDKSVKVNAGAVYPYDVLKGMITYRYDVSKMDLDHVTAQWKALPNFMGDNNVLPVVDVSGSMGSVIAASGLTALEVSLGLGLYCADKNTGVFKDIMVTFSGEPELQHLEGNIIQKLQSMRTNNWMTNTDIERTMKLILDTAVKNRVPQKDMPSILLILSDMQFDQATNPTGFGGGYYNNGRIKRDSGNKYNPTALQMTRQMYANAGYKMPKIVYWNLAAKYGNSPVKFDEAGTAMVSGFSPAILKSILSGSLEDFTPEAVMLKTVMIDRYALDLEA